MKLLDDYFAPSCGPKTIAEAMALPEIDNMLGQAITVFFGKAGIDGDSIIAFVDADGEAKTVHCIRRTKDGPDEWVKTRFLLP